MLTVGDHWGAREVMVCEDSLSLQPARFPGWVVFTPFEAYGVNTYRTAFDSKKRSYIQFTEFISVISVIVELTAIISLCSINWLVV